MTAEIYCELSIEIGFALFETANEHDRGGLPTYLAWMLSR
jgi:hypothetical protein